MYLRRAIPFLLCLTLPSAVLGDGGFEISTSTFRISYENADARCSLGRRGEVYCSFASGGGRVEVNYELERPAFEALLSAAEGRWFARASRRGKKAAEAVPVFAVEDDGGLRKAELRPDRDAEAGRLDELCRSVAGCGRRLYELQEAIRSGNGIVPALEALAAYLASPRAVNVEEFLPSLMRCLSDKRINGTAADPAVRCIGEIAGMDVPWDPARPLSGNLRATEQVFRWWQGNREKSRREWLADNMRRGEWKAARQLAALGDPSSASYLLESMRGASSSAAACYGALCRLTGRGENAKEARFWREEPSPARREKKLGQWRRRLTRKGFIPPSS